ncbi:MAG: hypothetical protein CVU92_06120 [Firmicutes bacterium HGW-Firmicutes-17]|jgi:hypothetical protein|nr:MAG: hypothetical protein CVU92_06120 [Firmicutes bacterium HGW-Firmicutes-17]
MITKSKKIKASFIAVITVILFFALSWYYVALINHALREQTLLYLSEVGTRGVALVESKVDNELESLKTTSKLIESSGNFDQSHMLKLINLEAGEGNYKRMAIALPNGDLMTSDGLAYNIADRPYFQEAIKGKATVSDTINDYTDDKPINVYAVPVFKEGQVVAVVIASVETVNMKRYLEVGSFSNQGYSYIVKANGDEVVSSVHANSPGAFDNIIEMLKEADLRDGDDLETISDNMATGKSGSFASYYAGMERYTIYKPLAINDWYMMTVVPTKVVSAQTSQIS